MLCIYYAIKLRLIYANKLRKSFTQITQITQLNYAGLRKYNYANTQNIFTQITQIPLFITQKFGSLRNGQFADGRRRVTVRNPGRGRSEAR